jgi:hypothetical protein
LLALITSPLSSTTNLQAYAKSSSPSSPSLYLFSMTSIIHLQKAYLRTQQMHSMQTWCLAVFPSCLLLLLSPKPDSIYLVSKKSIFYFIYSPSRFSISSFTSPPPPPLFFFSYFLFQMQMIILDFSNIRQLTRIKASARKIAEKAGRARQARIEKRKKRRRQIGRGGYAESAARTS